MTLNNIQTYKQRGRQNCTQSLTNHHHTYCITSADYLSSLNKVFDSVCPVRSQIHTSTFSLAQRRTRDNLCFYRIQSKKTVRLCRNVGDRVDYDIHSSDLSYFTSLLILSSPSRGWLAAGFSLPVRVFRPALPLYVTQRYRLPPGRRVFVAPNRGVSKRGGEG